MATSDGADGDEQNDSDVQISPRVPESLRGAHKAYIRLDNAGQYRGLQSKTVADAMSLQIAVWVLNHPYELRRCYDVEYVDDPDSFVSTVVRCVQENIEQLTDIKPQLDTLDSTSPDEIDKHTIRMLPQKQDSNGHTQSSSETASSQINQLRETNRELLRDDIEEAVFEAVKRTQSGSMEADSTQEPTAEEENPLQEGAEKSNYSSTQEN